MKRLSRQKRILATLLALILALSMVPSFAYESLQESQSATQPQAASSDTLVTTYYIKCTDFVITSGKYLVAVKKVVGSGVYYASLGEKDGSLSCGKGCMQGDYFVPDTGAITVWDVSVSGSSASKNISFSTTQSATPNATPNTTPNATSSTTSQKDVQTKTYNLVYSNNSLALKDAASSTATAFSLTAKNSSNHTWTIKTGNNYLRYSESKGTFQISSTDSSNEFVFFKVITVEEPCKALDESVSYLAFTSDVHNASDTADKPSSAEIYDQWIYNVSEYLGGAKFVAGFCGDYGSASAGSSDKYWSYAKRVIDIVDNHELITGSIFACGNHEHSPGQYGTVIKNTNNQYYKYAQRIALPGTLYPSQGQAQTQGQAQSQNYVIYSFGTRNNDVNGTGFVQSDIDELEAYLKSDQAPVDKPIIVISHFPLHILDMGGVERRITKNREQVIKVLNNASENHNIIFLWGHNHSQNDPMYDKVYESGYQLDGTTQINFTYAGVGAPTDYTVTAYGGNVRAKGLVLGVGQNGTVSLTYYDGYGRPFGETTVALKNQEISAYLAGYKNGKMIYIKPVYNQTVEDARNKKYSFTIPGAATASPAQLDPKSVQSDLQADTIKLFFVGDNFTPGEVVTVQ